jgi:hypothetical protein
MFLPVAPGDFVTQGLGLIFPELFQSLPRFKIPLKLNWPAGY